MQEEIKWADPKKSKYLNKHVPRVDGPGKVTGTAKYTFDIVLPGMLYAKILRSPHANARLINIDASAAQSMPGVRAVITDLSNQARYAGQEISAVAADTEEIARDAIKEIKCTWETAPHLVSTKTGVRRGERLGESREDNRGADPSTIWGTAAAVIEGEYYCPVREHLSLETHGLVIRWDGPETATVWISTQAVHGVVGELAGALGIPAANVTVICEYMGGGFGSKFNAGVEGRIAARLSKMTGRPVKLMLERYEEQVASGNGPDGLLKAKAAMASDGKLLAIQGEMFGTSGNSNNWGLPFPYIYRVPNVRIKQTAVSTNTGGARALRAPGHPQASFLMESVVDELACKLGLDPVAVRKINQNSDVRNQQLDLGAQKIGWSKRNLKPGNQSGRFQRGMGVACCTWGGGGGRGSQCDVKIGNDGKVWVGIGTQDLGTGVRTFVATIVAEELGIDLSKVKADIGNSKLGFSQGSGGSVTTGSVAPAVKMAAVAARQRVEEIAVGFIGAGPFEFRDGKINSASGKSATFEEICAKLPPGGIQERGAWNASLQTGGVAGAQFVEVEVDTWTGHIQPIKVVAVQDCGYALNRLTAESQLIGGVIQGISMALLEDRKMDEPTGRMLNPNMETYKVLGALEVPEIEAVLFDTHDKVTGIGEPAVIAAAAATANAVFNATGIRLRTLPMTPKNWFDAVEKSK